MFFRSMTRGEVLRYALAYALMRSRKVIRGLKEGLTEEERYAVADHTVAQLKERGDPSRLNEEQPTAKPPSTWEDFADRMEGNPPTPETPPSVLKAPVPAGRGFSLRYAGRVNINLRRDFLIRCVGENACQHEPHTYT
jgi:hypothetical protein